MRNSGKNSEKFMRILFRLFKQITLVSLLLFFVPAFATEADAITSEMKVGENADISKAIEPQQPVLSVAASKEQAETEPEKPSTPEIKQTPVSAATPSMTKEATGSAAKTETALAMRIVLGLTFLAVLPAILVSLTAFLRIVIVLSMLRHAIGMQETPPNMVIIGLALFMTLFTMSPVIQQVKTQAYEPFMQSQIGMEDAMEKGMRPMREFMIAQTRESDIALMVELSHAPEPKSMADVSNVQLIPAFMLSELRAAFQIGFLIFLPFLLIDLVVSSILMGLGMMMMPPTTIALPLKILMFILVDGWSLVMRALVGSFH